MAIDPVSLGITLAVAAINYGITASQTFEGPRLENLNITTGEYGVSLPIPFGVVRVNCAAIYAEPLREVKKKRKSKGGKYKEYKYYGTWCCAISGREITAVNTIRFDTLLVYVNGVSPVTEIEEDGLDVTDYLTIYLGTDTQAIDPRMQAKIDAQFGTGSTPAYRDTALLMFKEVPLEQMGNRLPTVESEIVATSGFVETVPDLFPWDEYTAAVYDVNFSPAFYESPWTASPDGKYLFGSNNFGDTSWVFNTVTNTLEYATNYNDMGGWIFLTALGAIDSAGAVYYQSAVDPADIYRVNLASPNSWTYIGSLDWINGDTAQMRVFDMPGGNTYVLFYCGVPSFDAENDIFIYNKNAGTFTSVYTAALYSAVDCAFQDDVGDIWVTNSSEGSLSLIRVTNITGSSPYLSSIVVGGLPAAEYNWPELAGYCYNGNFVGGMVDYAPPSYYKGFKWGVSVNLATGATNGLHNSGLYYLWPETYAINANQTVVYVIPDSDYVGQSRDMYAFNPVTLSIDLGDSYSLDNWNIPTDTEQFVRTNMYLPGINAFVGASWVSATEGHLFFYFLTGGGSLTLGVICSEVAVMANITDYNFTALDQPVQGWYFLRGSAMTGVDPLLNIYDSEIRLNGFTMEGIKRGGATVTTIDSSEFLEDRPRYKLEVVQPIEMPKALTVNYADIGMDKQTNSTRDARAVNTTDTQDERTVNMNNWTSDPVEATQFTQRLFRRIWNSDILGGQKLPNQYFNLLTGDLVGFVYDGEAFGMRLQKIKYNFQDDYMDVECVYDEAGFAVVRDSDLISGGFGLGAPPATLYVPVASQGFALDFPLLDDSHDWTTPQIYFASGPNTIGNWPGSTFFKYYDGDYTVEGLTFLSSERATWGVTTNALATANAGLWDRGNTIDVTISASSGSFLSTTEAACEANPLLNLIRVGNEVIQFTTATLVSTDIWQLSGLRRGMRGTEWAMSTHAIGDSVLLLDMVKLQHFGLSDVGTSMSWKDITLGMGPTGADVDALSPFTGATLKPYSVVDFEAAWSSNDIITTWERRTRIGGAWRSSQTVPLSEDSEQYQIDVMDGVTVKRTATINSAQTWTYTSAMQVTDFGSNQTTVTMRIYQISAAVGRGFVNQQTFTA